jgi:hypothetical protein
MRHVVHECEVDPREDLLFVFAKIMCVNDPDTIPRFTCYVLKGARMCMEDEGEHSEYVL